MAKAEEHMMKFLRRQAKMFIVPGHCTLCYKSTEPGKQMCHKCMEFVYCSRDCLIEDKISHRAYCRGFIKHVPKHESQFGLNRWTYGDVDDVSSDEQDESFSSDDDDEEVEEEPLPPPRRPLPLPHRRPPRPRAIPPLEFALPPNRQAPRGDSASLLGAKRRLEF